MRKVYSHENLAIVTSAKNLLELNNINSFLKNEFHASGGHVGFEAVPIELWVQDDAAANTAITILERELAESNTGDAWVCVNCGEHNEASFETCWKCQQASPNNDGNTAL